MKLAIVAAVVLVTTLGAGAQELVPAPMIPGLAERAPATRGITEQGRSVVMLPADRLKLVVRTYAAPVQNGPAVTTAATAADAEKAVVEIMRANGIPDARIFAPVLGSVNANDEIVGTIARPTHDRVAGIEQRIVAALPSGIVPVLRNVNLEGTLEVDTCATAIERARGAAYADARKRAEALASAAGVRLSALVNATEVDQTSGCLDFANGPVFAQNAPSSLFDGTVAVGVSLTATFAIAP